MQLEEAGYLVVWEFRVRSEMARRFEEIYGPNGRWAQLMAASDGYIRSHLHRDLKHPLRYLTIDFWQTADAYIAFRNAHEAEYLQMDRDCEELTEREIEIGIFGAALP